MKENKSNKLQKHHQNENLTVVFKEKCKIILKRQPQIYLCNFIKGNILQFNTSIFKIDDMPFIETLLSLPFKKIIIFYEQELKKASISKQIKSSSNNIVKLFHQTYKFKQLLKSLNKFLQQGQSLRSLTIKGIPLQQKFIKQLCTGIEQTKYLKELNLIKCQLGDAQLAVIKSAIASNMSIISLDLSYNQLGQSSGGMIGKILSDHSQRRTEVVWIYGIRDQKPQYDISSTGICEVSLESNQINDKAAQDFVTFLKDDTWTRYINLSKNQIKGQGIRQFALLLKNNQSLLSLDLRQNPGLTKQFSKFIFKKLIRNMEAYKKNQKFNNDKERKKYEFIESPLKFNKSGNLQKIKQEQSLSLNQFSASQTNNFNSINSQLISKTNRSSQFKVTTNNKQCKTSLIYKKNTLKESSGKQVQKVKLDESNFNEQNNCNQRNDFITIGSKQTEQIHYQSANLITVPSTQTVKKQKLFKGKVQTNNNQLASNSFKILNSQKKDRGSSHKKNHKQSFSYHQKMSNQSSHRMQNLNQDSKFQCKKCVQNQLKLLKAEKINIELELKLRRLNHFIAKNVQHSIIGGNTNVGRQLNISNPPMYGNQNSLISSNSFNKYLTSGSENDEQMISKMEMLMSELTKIMETVELHQNTQNTIQNAFSNINSLSNTVNLYGRPGQMEELDIQILQDENLNIRSLQGDQDEEN